MAAIVSKMLKRVLASPRPMMGAAEACACVAAPSPADGASGGVAAAAASLAPGTAVDGGVRVPGAPGILDGVVGVVGFGGVGGVVGVVGVVGVGTGVTTVPGAGE